MKINRVQNAIDNKRAFSNKPHNVSDSARRSVTRKYRNDVKRRIDSFYKNNLVARQNALTKLGNSDIDHILDLQIGGRNVRSNLKSLDSRVNQDLGQQFSRQLPDGINVIINGIKIVK